MKPKIILILISLCVTEVLNAGSTSLEKQNMSCCYSNNIAWNSSRPDGHAPIGIMGDHLHKSGEWMLSYRYMYMEMDGNLDGTNSLSVKDVFSRGFMVSPTEMTMEAHMLGLMYAPSDFLTIMAMLPYKRITMEHETRAGANFSTETEGIGDVSLTGLILLKKWDKQQLHLNAGISFPTGAIDERGDTPAGNNQKLPYPMQLGSGTFDLLPGITYLGQSDSWSWGSQLGGKIRLDENDEGYTLGDEAFATFWLAKKWANWVSTSLRINGKIRDNIDGNDSELNPLIVPTADPNLRGGKLINALFGVNLYKPSGRLKGSRLAVEIGVPVYQHLDGPQLENEFSISVGYQFSW